MRKEKLMDEVNENAAASTGSKTPEVKKEKIVREVEMENGTVINFGARANLLTQLDLEENTVTFNHSNGKVVVFKQEDIAATEDEPAFEFSKAPELIRKVFLYGIQERVKSSTGPIKNVEDIYAEVLKQVSAINEGNFYIRSLAGEVEEEASLTDLQQAYALAKAQLQPEQFGHWVETKNPEVIKEILDLWETYTLGDKAKIRNNFVVARYLADIKAAKSGDKTVELI